MSSYKQYIDCNVHLTQAGYSKHLVTDAKRLVSPTGAIATQQPVVSGKITPKILYPRGEITPPDECLAAVLRGECIRNVTKARRRPYLVTAYLYSMQDQRIRDKEIERW